MNDMNVKKKILFVDDEPRVLDGLRRMLRPVRDEWDALFAGSGQDALRVMENRQFDVIVSDIRMPGMSGTELLIEVKKLYPSTIRIALSGQADKDSIFKSVGPIHQYLSKPCDADQLKATVARAFALKEMIENEKLKKAVAEMESLPSVPEHYKELLAELEKPDCSIKVIEQIVSKDMGMSAKLLQLVNSAFFGIGKSVSDPARAVVLLGLDTVKRLALMTHVFSQFQGDSVPGFKTDDLWDHSILSAGLAKRIAILEQADEKTSEESFIAGLLHDVGKLVLAFKVSEDYRLVYRKLSENGTDFNEIEKSVLGATHAEVGAYLLGLWGLSDSMVEAVAYHHSPQKGSFEGFTPLTAVYVANAIAHNVETYEPGESPSWLCMDYLARLGKTDRVPEWIEAYQIV
ncbi:MAG TPA: HDOD domain-containing protein [Firmicutes bacterium]|nr:HDOD domain-containing protein [Bacillota bacterium]